MLNNTRPLRFALVAGEASGDLLGSDLIVALRECFPNATFEGIAGPLMIEQGCQSLYPMDRLAVMGITEVLGRYRELHNQRNKLAQYFIANPPDVFIGIDAPDYNHVLEKKLKNAGIKTVHYVSPSVWAWRKYRLKKIKHAVDLMLTLFPFEEEFYKQHGIPVKFVGHPLANMIAFEPDSNRARKELSLPLDKKIIAILPGSRNNEVNMLSEDFIKTAAWCYKKMPTLIFIIPFVNDKHKAHIKLLLDKIAPDLPVTLYQGQSRTVMEAADAVLLACGTAALEAMLLKRPMVVAYRLSAITYRIAKFLVQIKYYSLPNNLSDNHYVPEYIQNDIIPANMGEKLMSYIKHPEQHLEMKTEFLKTHKILRQDASRSAAVAIQDLLNRDQ